MGMEPDEARKFVKALITLPAALLPAPATAATAPGAPTAVRNSLESSGPRRAGTRPAGAKRR